MFLLLKQGLAPQAQIKESIFIFDSNFVDVHKLFTGFGVQKCRVLSLKPVLHIKQSIFRQLKSALYT